MPRPLRTLRVSVPPDVLAAALAGDPAACARILAHTLAASGAAVTVRDLADRVGISRRHAHAALASTRDSGGTSEPRPTPCIATPRDSGGTGRDTSGTAAGQPSRVQRRDLGDDGTAAGQPRDNATARPFGAGQPTEVQPRLFAVRGTRSEEEEEEEEEDQDHARGPAASALRAVLVRWAAPRVEGGLLVDVEADLAWLTRDVLPRHAGVDASDVIQQWGAYLESQYRLRLAGHRNSWPRPDWKRSLRTAFDRAARGHHATVPPTPPAPAGATRSHAAVASLGHACERERGAYRGVGQSLGVITRRSTEEDLDEFR